METIEQNQELVQPKDNKKPTDFNISWATVTISVLLSLVFSLASLVIYSKFLMAQVYTIKIDEILADHIRTIGAANLTDEQKQKIANDWSIAFDDSVKELYANRNVVLTQQAVVLGGTDYTDQLKKEIASKMDAKAGLK